ncbi:MAG: glycoside hydrolase family 127 protein [Armatimonadetes bacterium]|nr:glycoside hydrolase family 127 protein [Armatimonadota bacterium]
MLASLLLPLVMAPPANHPVPIRVPVAIEPFDLRDVQLTDGPCKTALEANRRYLLSIPNDRLLWTFRQNAGLPTAGEPLGGWEAPTVEVRGHFPGHYLSACALLIRNTGDPELKAKADAIVGELGKVQDALGDGFLSAYPASFIDRLERMEKVTLAPLYVTHKIMAGLLDMYSPTGTSAAPTGSPTTNSSDC